VTEPCGDKVPGKSNAATKRAGEDSVRILDPELVAILDTAAVRRGIDFRDYRSPALTRGIRERLRVTGCADPAAYRRYLDEQPEELSRLCEALVVPVTSFFRDAEVFAALGQYVLPRLVAQRAPSQPLRAWCIGVSTGEEAWSLAMLLTVACESADEKSDEKAGAATFDLVATDIDAQALERARGGGYRQSSLAAVPAALRRRFFIESDGERVSESLRARVRFAEHDFMGRSLAPPCAIVASFELVLIRNVLIYFDRRLQEKAFDRLASAIEPGGVLVLGPVEILPSSMARYFMPLPEVDPRHGVYLRTGML
jgi:two-component system CheB/CheR fusion protein